MDIPKAVEKVRARASHVLDLQIALEERFAMLQPLAFDEDLVERIGSGPPGRGRVLLQNALLESCVQVLVKLSLGTDKKAPSLRNIMVTLAHEGVRGRLREDYAVVPPPVALTDAEPMADDVHEFVVQAEKERLESEFLEIWQRLAEGWALLADDDRLVGFKTWRDKLIAHSDLHHVEGEYQLLDLKELQLKWGDLGDLIRSTRQVVSDANSIVRSAGFAWDMLEQQVGEASSRFWMLVGNGENDRGAT